MTQPNVALIFGTTDERCAAYGCRSEQAVLITDSEGRQYGLCKTCLVDIVLTGELNALGDGAAYLFKKGSAIIAQEKV
jgi:hypothetical protein